MGAVEDVNTRMVEVAREYEYFREPLCTTAPAAFLDNYRALGRELARLTAAVGDGSRVGGRLDGELARINVALAALRAACTRAEAVAPPDAEDGGGGARPARVVEVSGDEKPFFSAPEQPAPAPVTPSDALGGARRRREA